MPDARQELADFELELIEWSAASKQRVRIPGVNHGLHDLESAIVISARLQDLTRKR
jgi:hypothetical protein